MKGEERFPLTHPTNDADLVTPARSGPISVGDADRDSNNRRMDKVRVKIHPSRLGLGLGSCLPP